MALDQSALLELLEALKVADVDDRICSATEALIEPELTAAIGASSDTPRSHRCSLSVRARMLCARAGQAAVPVR